jgi:hypothetical protein
VEALRVAGGWRSHIFRHSAHRWRQGCQPYEPVAFYPQERFLVLISVRGWVDPRAIVRLKGLGKFKKSTSSGIRTGDLPACSIVPQPTTLPRAPSFFSYVYIFNIEIMVDPYPLKITLIFVRNFTGNYLRCKLLKLSYNVVNHPVDTCGWGVCRRLYPCRSDRWETPHLLNPIKPRDNCKYHLL